MSQSPSGAGWESELWISRDNSTLSDALPLIPRQTTCCLSSLDIFLLGLLENIKLFFKKNISSLHLLVVLFPYILVSAFTPFMKLIVFKTIKTNFRNSLFTNSSYLSRHSFVLIMKEMDIFIPIPKLKCQLYLRKSNL